MRSEREPHYLYAHRKRLGLSQDDVSQLTGCRSGRKFGKYEAFSVEPGLRTVLACELIFDTPVRVLFAGMFEAAQLSTSKQAKRLIKRLERRKRVPDAVKVEALRRIVRTCQRSRNIQHHA